MQPIKFPSSLSDLAEFNKWHFGRWFYTKYLLEKAFKMPVLNKLAIKKAMEKQWKNIENHFFSVHHLIKSAISFSWEVVRPKIRNFESVAVAVERWAECGFFVYLFCSFSA
jgi:hypothetical protein